MTELTQEVREVPRMSSSEQFVRWGVFAFLLVALLSLAFGVGYVTSDLRSDDEVIQTVVDGGAANEAVSEADPIGGTLLEEIIDLIESRYVDRESINPDVLREGAIAGVINTLNDPHTSYISEDDLLAGVLDLNATYDGIGASVTDRNGVVEIVAPFRDSPAEQSGIRAGDIILEVDGESTEGWTDQEAVQRIRGLRGTPVTLTVQHTDGVIETVIITRGEIQIESVFTEPNFEIIPGESGADLVDSNAEIVTDLAYINIAQFHENTVNELREVMAAVEAGGFSGLIVDLRGNPGGLLSATVQAADEFLDSGTILIEVDAAGSRTTHVARKGSTVPDIPIVVLQDQSSASGSEVLAAALRDNGRATIVGTRSFGKGTVNQIQPLTGCGDPDGCGALYLSVGRWLAPGGEQIEGLGVVPDILVEMTFDEYVEQGDLQMFAAIDELRSQQ